MRFYDLNNVANTAQVVTLTFSKPIQNLSFSLLDIDSQREPRRRLRGPRHHQHGRLDRHQARQRDRLRHRCRALPARPNTDSPWPAAAPTPTSTSRWTGPISSVSFIYKQNGSVNGNPFIGISDIAFQYCL